MRSAHEILNVENHSIRDAETGEFHVVLGK